MLHQLPNGDWIDPSLLQLLTAVDATELTPGGYVGPRVIYEVNGKRGFVECADVEAACVLRDKLAEMANSH